MKIVRYNGGTQSYFPCSRPFTLVKGKEYQVLSINDLGWQTNFVLAEVDGEFNSAWFDEPEPSKMVYTAIAHNPPIIGERYLCYRLSSVANISKLGWCLTSQVQGIKYLGRNMYKVTTCNNIYIVTVGA